MASGKYAIIWMVVLDDTELTDGAKILFGRLSSLSVKEGYAYATNESLANMQGCSVRTVVDYLRQLKHKQYIEIVTHEGQRRIYTNFDNRGNRVRENLRTTRKSAQSVRENSRSGVRENLRDGYAEICAHNNITSNTINSNSIKEEVRLPWEVEEFRTAWGHWKQYRKDSHRFNYAPLGEQAALIKLQKLSGDNLDTALEIIEQSMSQGWKGLFKLKDNGQTDKTWEGLDAALRNRGH